MRMRYLILVAGICLALTAPVYAVSGHVDMRYDCVSWNWVWGVGLQKELGEYLAVGTALDTHCPNYGYKGVVPSWIPHMQRYEVWAEVRWQGMSVRLTDWCDHYLAQSGIRNGDKWGLNLRLRYDF